MESTYWERLEYIKKYAAFFQENPIPEDDYTLIAHLENIEYLLDQMVNLIAPNGVWCGEPDDPCRKGLPMAPSRYA